jgi:hypothetical protein
MGLSKIDVCNQALLKVGADVIESLDTDVNSEEGTVESALLCNVFFDQSLDEVLRLYQWNSCTKRDIPVKLTAEPAFGYSNAFQLPNDFVRLIRATDNPDYWVDDTEWVLEDGKILCDYDQIYIRYIATPQNIGDLDALATQALICNLAIKLAVPLQQSNDIATRITNELYNIVLPQAKAIDTFENMEVQLPESQWITARNYTW